MINLDGKKILFIGVKFYDYNEEIIKKLRSLGAEVTFFYERDTTIRYGIYNRLLHSRLNALQSRYYAGLLKKVKDSFFDYLLVIRGNRMPEFFIQKIKGLNPLIKTIMYQWDSNMSSPFLNLPPGFNVARHFDKVLSFDFRDVEENSFLQYAPTFHTDEFITSAFNKEDEVFDFFYFGNYLPERYQGLINFKRFADEHGFTFHHYLYMHWRHFWIEWIKGTKLNSKLIKFKKLSRNEYVQLFRKSRVIVDVSNANQTGLAMRVLDALGAGKKVLTTNKWIIKEKSYSPDQVVLFDINNIEIPDGFLKTNQRVTSFNYSIDKWIERIFGSVDPELKK